MKNSPIREFWSDERGAVAVEYGLLAAMIAVAIVSLATAAGALSTLYEEVRDVITAVGDPGEES